jgi:formate dehydrogenase subunit gamma
MAGEDSGPVDGNGAARHVRHTLADRLFHWLSAIAVLVLLATALLPILGVEFSWVTIHWISGLTLALLVTAHIVRATFWQGLRSMWIGIRDLGEGWAAARSAIGAAGVPVKVGGKYSLAQKAIHHAFAVVVLTAIATGSLMLVKIDTPWWRRDPYWLGDDTWGLIYVLHDLASLCLVTMVIVHIYFALRPEKFYLTRAMLRGWITGHEYHEHYDTTRWKADRN